MQKDEVTIGDEGLDLELGLLNDRYGCVLIN